MKRSTGLVDYASSDDDGDATHEEEKPAAPAAKKRRLPTLADAFVAPTPIDNPALHQGRVRSSPHVEGQFAAYVYVPLSLGPRTSPLSALLDKLTQRAKEMVPTLHAIAITENEEANKDDADMDISEKSNSELHISLTRPVFLRAHQREEFKVALKAVAKRHRQFQASFATLAELTNDEQTRTFLTLEVGAGHTELKSLCNAVTPILRTYRQKEFYSEPRFHVSIAWALLTNAARKQPSTSTPTGPTKSPTIASGASSSSSDIVANVPTATQEKQTDPPAEISADNRGSSTTEFPTIPHFPLNFISTLEAGFGTALRSRAVGAFECDHLCVRIGKDVTRWRLAG